MTIEHIARSIDGASRYLSEHPEEARYTDSTATAVVSGLATTVGGSDGESVATDMPASVGGGDTAPSPGWLMRAAMASCVATLIAMRAAHQEVVLSTLEVAVDSESDDRGILGLDDEIPAGPLSTRVAVRIAAPAVSDDQIHQLVDWAYRHCPVTDTVQRAVPTTLEVELAG